MDLKREAAQGLVRKKSGIKTVLGVVFIYRTRAIAKPSYPLLPTV